MSTNAGEWSRLWSGKRNMADQQAQAQAPVPDGEDYFTNAAHAIKSVKERQAEDHLLLIAIRDQQVTDGASLTAIENLHGVRLTAIENQQVTHGVRLTTIENQLTAIRDQQVVDGGTLVAIQNQLAALNAALGGGISIPQRQAMAISCNNHDNDHRQYVPVPTDAGIIPPHWPAGLSRSYLRGLNVPAMNLLLTDFGLNIDGNAVDKRNRLAEHIGTARF